MSQNTKKRERVPIKEGLWTPTSANDVGRLIGSKCMTCGEIFFPRKRIPRCIHCGNQTLVDTLLSEKGKIASYTVSFRKPAGGYYNGPIPFAYGCVDLPEGVRILGLFAECDFKQLAIGVEVKQIIDTLCEDDQGREILTYKFRPC
jgi:uncharacterized protein